MTGNALRAKRMEFAISGYAVCRKCGFSRSRLSNIERGYITPTPDELTRISGALDDLIRAKLVLQQTAAALGWPCQEVTHD
jgi:transcriptional regulator with XRE-family HTH domain